MQLPVNNVNITTFRVQAFFDFYNRKLTFEDISTYAGSSGSGIFSIQGISFRVEDQQGVVLMDYSFTDPTKYIVPSATRTFDLDLSQFPYSFLAQNYKISAAIKDSTGIYYTTPVIKKVCQPAGVTDSGYVQGLFQVTSNCPNNVLTVKDVTPFIYNNQAPDAAVTKSGILYYPTGTISPVSFTGTPFTNNAIYTGEYRINCTAVAEYDLGDDFYVLVTYITNNVFDITCANKIADLACCIMEYQSTYLKNCDNATGKNAKALLDSIQIPFLLGLTKEINGQDASVEADIIKKKLKCNCGASSLRQNEFTPINPSTNSIVLVGGGGTSIPAPIPNGNTLQYTITSSVYQVTKGDTGDLGFTITADTSIPNLVKYKVVINYNSFATNILNAISADPTLVSLLNSLISYNGGVNLTGLNGKCVIDLSSINYFLTQNINSGTKITALSTNTTDYAAPANLYASDIASVQSWLNSLGLGVFTVSGGSTSIGILSLNNAYNLSSVTFTSPNTTAFFQKTNATLVSVLQAIVDYLCTLTALQVTLGNTITLWQIDYNGNPSSQSFTSGVSQSSFNQGVADSIYNIVQTILSLTGVTCAKIRAAFSDSPTAVFGASGRIYGTPDGASCVSFSDKQIAALVIAAINKYADLKVDFCAIDCTVPGTCPDIISSSLAMAGSTTIGLYGVTWSATPAATQNCTVRYKKNSVSTWTTATNSLDILPNGNLQGTTPFSIGGVSQGEVYDVQVINNCGGAGFINQITVPVVGVYSASFLLDNIIYNICGQAPVTLYSATPFAVGVQMFTNIGLTIPVTGYAYISDNVTGEIYTLNSSTGVVLSDTGLSCTTGVANKVFLSNTTVGICGNTSLTRYTNGAFAIGSVLYTDSSLTTPVTGYSYVLNVVNGHIYNLNSVTGVIGSDTGLTCTAYSGTFQRANTELAICGATPETLYSPAPFAPGVTMYTDSGLTTLATGDKYIADSTGAIYNMNSVTALVGAATENAC